MRARAREQIGRVLERKPGPGVLQLLPCNLYLVEPLRRSDEVREYYRQLFPHLSPPPAEPPGAAGG